MGEPSNPHFYDFGIPDASFSPKTNIIYLSRPQDTSNNSRKIKNHFQNTFFWEHFKNWHPCVFAVSGKDRRRTIPTIRRIISWKSWIWDQYLPEHMKWNFGNMGSISSEKIFNDFRKFEIWNFGTLKPRNQETEKPRNFETFLFPFEGVPATPEHTDSHPCTSPPSWGTRGNLGDTSLLPETY